MLGFFIGVWMGFVVGYVVRSMVYHRRGKLKVKELI